MKNLLVSDIAGTSVQDDGRVLDCFTAALGLHGVQVKESRVQALMGRGKLETILELVNHDQDRAHLIYASFCRILEQSYDDRAPEPIEGVEATFTTLRNRGWGVALNTGFYKAVTNKIIQSLGWENRVDAVVTDNDVKQGRPAPWMIFEAMYLTGVWNVRNVVVIGDTESDMQAGHNANVAMVVGVTTGGVSRSALLRAGAHGVIDSIADLPGVLKESHRLKY